MGHLKWRRSAAIVGYLDVVLSLLGIIGTIVSGAAIAVAAHRIEAAKPQPAEAERLKREKLQEPEPTNETIYSGYIPKSPVTGYFIVPLNLIWVSVGVAGFLTFLQLVAAVRMLKATEVTYDPIQAIGPSRFWLGANIIIILVSAPFYIFLFGQLGAPGYVGGLLIRLLMLYVVYQFMIELMTRTSHFNKKNRARIGPT